MATVLLEMSKKKKNESKSSCKRGGELKLCSENRHWSSKRHDLTIPVQLPTNDPTQNDINPLKKQKFFNQFSGLQNVFFFFIIFFFFEQFWLARSVARMSPRFSTDVVSSWENRFSPGDNSALNSWWRGNISVLDDRYCSTVSFVLQLKRICHTNAASPCPTHRLWSNCWGRALCLTRRPCAFCTCNL